MSAFCNLGQTPWIYRAFSYQRLFAVRGNAIDPGAEPGIGTPNTSPPPRRHNLTLSPVPPSLATATIFWLSVWCERAAPPASGPGSGGVSMVNPSGTSASPQPTTDSPPAANELPPRVPRAPNTTGPRNA